MDEKILSECQAALLSIGEHITRLKFTAPAAVSMAENRRALLALKEKLNQAVTLIRKI